MTPIPPLRRGTYATNATFAFYLSVEDTMIALNHAIRGVESWAALPEVVEFLSSI